MFFYISMYYFHMNDGPMHHSCAAAMLYFIVFYWNDKINKSNLSFLWIVSEMRWKWLQQLQYTVILIRESKRDSQEVLVKKVFKKIRSYYCQFFLVCFQIHFDRWNKYLLKSLGEASTLHGSSLFDQLCKFLSQGQSSRELCSFKEPKD